MFIMELLARTIMRDDLNGSEALFVDLDRKIGVFKLVEICTKMLGQEFRGSPDCVQNYIKPKMKKVQIITVDDFDHWLFFNIEDHLRENPRISLVLLDSLGQFIEIYPDSDSDSGPSEKKKEGEGESSTSKGFRSLFNDDVSKHLQRLKRMAEKFQVCIVASVPPYVKLREGIADVKVELSKIKDGKFHMNINDNKEVAFTIGFYGIQTADPPTTQTFLL